MNMPFVSVIILNHDGRDYLKPCLSSVLNSTYDEFEVILADNDSVDGSIEYVRHHFSQAVKLKVVALNKNYGFAVGNNMGYQKVDPKSKYVIFLNNDTQVERDWMQEIIKKMENDPLIGAAQPKIRLMSDRNKIDAAGCTIDYYGRPFRLGNGETDQGQYDSISEIFFALGAAIALRKEVIEKVGLFDSSFFAYYEETDLCWRIWLVGYKVVLVPKAIVYHWGGATAKRKASMDASVALKYRVFYRRRNQLIMMLKNYSLSNIIKYVLPFGARIPVVALIRFAKGQSAEGLAYLDAIWSVLTSLSEITKKREHVQKTIRKLPDSEVMKLMISPVG